MDRRDGISRRAVLAGSLLGVTSVVGCLSRDDPEEDANPVEDIRFEEIGDQIGFQYEYQSPEDPGQKDILTNAGVYVADVTNSGSPDILALGGSEPTLFENTGGEFEPRESLPGIDDETEYTGALFFDVGGTGWEDLLLLARQGPPLFLENDEGEFTPRSVGFDSIDWPATGEPVGAAAADYNGNGSLDVFIIQNGNWTTSQPEKLVSGALIDPDDDNGAPNYLFAGDGEEFTQVEDAGIAGNRWSLAVSFVDLTGNGYPDIHVGNDYNFDVFYSNQGDGTFDRQDIPGSDRHAMSSTVADVTGDGALDIFVTNIYYPSTYAQNVPFARINMEGNNLFTFDDGELVDRARDFDLHRGGWGWATVAADFGNTGTRDVIHTTMPVGTEREIEEYMERSIDEVREEYSYLEYPAVFLQEGDAEFSQPRARDVGFDLTDARGLAALDFDGSGTLDLVFANAREVGQTREWTGQYRFYENDSNAGNWLQVEVEPTDFGPAIGAFVTVTTEETEFVDVYHSRTHFLSQSWRTLHFGLGDGDTVDVSVQWPDGTTQTLEDLAVNRRIVVGPDGEIEG